MVDILNDVNEIYPVDSMLQECALNVTGVDSSSPKLRFKLELYAGVIQKGTVYTQDQYYFTIPQDAFIKVLNQFSSSLGIQEDIDDLGDPDYNGSSSSKFENDYVWIRWTSYQLYVKIKWDKGFNKSYDVVTFYNGSYYFDLSIRLYADPFYQNINYFDVNGVSYGGQSVEINTTFTLPATSVTAVGYRSAGWYTSRTGGAYVGAAGGNCGYICLTGYDFEAYKNTDLNLYEHQELIPIYVRFNANGGFVSPSSSSVSGGGSITLPTPTRDNHDFYGWYDSGGTKVGDAGDSYKPVSDIELYARWKERYIVSIRDLQTEGSTYRESYIHNMDTSISGLPSSISREGFTFGGYCLDSTEAVKFANTSGNLIPGISGYTDASGQYLLSSALSLFALWSRIEYTITFDAMGGTLSEKDSKRVTYEGKILDFPSVSRAGYVLKGWTENPSAEEVSYVTESTIFSENTTLYADWEEVKVSSDVLCYLERYYDGTAQRFIFPIVSDISDTISASLVEMDTIMFGYKNRFVMDMGVKQTYSVAIERVSPVSPDDSGSDFDRYSNSKWWEMFLDYINFWQNDGRSQNGERTGGFKFVYAPSESYKELYPTIEKNVFISGQISARISTDRLSFTLPLAVATMDAKSSLKSWKATFRKIADPESESFEAEEIIGSSMTLPGPKSNWVSMMQGDGKSFSHWVLEGNPDSKYYYPGAEFDYDSNYLSDIPVFNAVWVSTDETWIYYVSRFDTIGRGPLKYEYEAKTDCTVEVTMYGGGGSGGKGTKTNRTWPRKDYYHGGGGGGAPTPVTTSFRLKAEDVLYIELGLGGLSEARKVDEYWAPYEENGTHSAVWVEGFESNKEYSGIGQGKGVSTNGGTYNGGKGGTVEDGNKMNRGEDGKGSMGGIGANGLELLAGSSSYFAFYGGGGGGGSIPYMRKVEFTCEGVTYKTAYHYTNPSTQLYLNGTQIYGYVQHHLQRRRWGICGQSWKSELCS